MCLLQTHQQCLSRLLLTTQYMTLNTHLRQRKLETFKPYLENIVCRCINTSWRHMSLTQKINNLAGKTQLSSGHLFLFCALMSFCVRRLLGAGDVLPLGASTSPKGFQRGKHVTWLLASSNPGGYYPRLPTVHTTTFFAQAEQQTVTGQLYTESAVAAVRLVKMWKRSNACCILGTKQNL